jgi:excinuclease ABC subunit A
LIDQALRVGGGILFAIDNHGKETVHSTHRVCPSCSRSFEPLDPKNFSYTAVSVGSSSAAAAGAVGSAVVSSLAGELQATAVMRANKTISFQNSFMIHLLRSNL